MTTVYTVHIEERLAQDGPSTGFSVNVVGLSSAVDLLNFVMRRDSLTWRVTISRRDVPAR